jgi:hypothetical protein
MSIGRSFIKGPRFAFRDTSTVCVPCVFGERYRRGAPHTCGDACGDCGGSGVLAVTLEGTLRCGVCGGSGMLGAGRRPGPDETYSISR